MKLSEPKGTITGVAVLKILEGALGCAQAEGFDVFIAVTDGAGRPTGLLGTENAAYISRQISSDKAFTAAVTGMPTADWKAYVESIPDEERRIIDGQPGYIAAAGGLPIIVDGLVVGGVGVSGANQEVDEACARAGLAAIGLDGPS